jgi:serine/threonine protein kinase
MSHEEMSDPSSPPAEAITSLPSDRPSAAGANTPNNEARCTPPDEDEPVLAEEPGRESTTAWQHGPLPERIGSYKILGVLGQGGMGVVYLAEQEKPRRQVALKVIRPEKVSPAMLRRFEYEGELLARLQHPGIAQIFEAGMAPSEQGRQPFFAMEYIKGQSLLAYARAKHLDVRQRLALFIKVCEAVEHAHQRGIIHRDLKPGNLLVDETGQPKLLDLGVARMTEAEANAKPQTFMGQLVGTLDYMSPEQATANPNDLDTRADVYSQGVLFYQLLSGKLPYPVKGKAIPEAVRIICEEEPAPLGSHDKAFRGDLQTIAAKALEKDRARRYQSAADLARDIERYLHDEPILARRPSKWYQFRKFARRNKALVTGLCVILVLLVGGIIGTTSGWVRAREAEQERSRELANSAAYAARLAAQRGDWEKALENYTRAIELGHEDEIGLRLGRLDCWIALAQFEPFKKELDGLGQRRDLGKYEGKVLLRRAGVALFEGDAGQGDGMELLRQAEAKGLGPADQAFVQAIKAETAPEVVKHLKRTVELDPFHRQAYDGLLLMLLLLGRTDEAREVTAQAKLVIPNSTTLKQLEVLLHAMRGDLATAEKLTKGVPSNMTEPTRLLAELCYCICQEDFHWGGPSAQRGQALQPKFLMFPDLLSQLWGGKGGGDWGDIQVLKLPFMKGFDNAFFWRELKAGNKLAVLSLFDKEKLAEMFGVIAQTFPEGTYHYLHGVMLQQAGRLEKAEQAYHTVAQLPAFAKCQRKALYEAIKLQHHLANFNEKGVWQVRPAYRDKAIANLRRLAQRGGLPSCAPAWATSEMAQIAILSKEPSLALSLIQNWEERTPQDLKNLIGLSNMMGEFTLALDLLQDWQKRSPLDLDLLRQRAQVEWSLGAYQQARQSALAVLKKQPTDTSAIRTYNLATQYLKNLSPLVKNAPELLSKMPTPLEK